MAAITEHLSIANEPIEAMAQSALTKSSPPVGARRGALVVTTAGGTQVLAIGNMDLLEESEHRVPADRLVVHSAHNGELMALAVAGEGGCFTAHERDVLEAAAAVLQPWVRVALQRSGRVNDEGGIAPFDVDRPTRLGDDSGGRPRLGDRHSIPDMALRPEFMQAQVVRIKNELRPSDFAGRLTSGEIAVLLRDTRADQAAVVSDRLKKLLQWDVTAGRPMEPSIRMISCSPESPCEVPWYAPPARTVRAICRPERLEDLDWRGLSCQCHPVLWPRTNHTHVVRDRANKRRVFACNGRQTGVRS